ncbi:MAG: hypothetical protein CMB56_005585 [Methanobacteriota archaeon]|nr:MAG: hypothetical protein CMB56_005585 [Euryarchaeota archaeon]|tara:strand:- start:18123 stop:19382 length:1260 start_codon:yes stop_codon:yes gene_type:complete
MAWSTSDLFESKDVDSRVPVTELESRQLRLSKELRKAGYDGALIHNPIDLYYFCGGRQDSTMFIPAEGSEATSIQYVRRSLSRAKFEAGDDDSIHEVVKFPRLSELSSDLKSRGVNRLPSMQLSNVPYSFAKRFQKSLSNLDGELIDCNNLVHKIREIKSKWEIEQMRNSAEIQLEMFDSVAALGCEGITELELTASAEAISRAAGFGGTIAMRRYPMQCNRGVVVAGRSGGIPSFFDAAIGGTGSYSGSGMGSGFRKIKQGEPVLVDLLHAHRGYIVDMTRMFVVGRLSKEWIERLDDMQTIKEVVVDALDQRKTCTDAWNEGYELACELGYSEHLMGMKPDQSRFLGHGVGLELDESPVIATGFDRPLNAGNTIAIEPKVIYQEGSIGTEDTWLMTESGMEPITAGAAFPWIFEWGN